MASRKSIFRGAAAKEKEPDAAKKETLLGGVAVGAVAQAVAHMSPHSLRAFLHRLNEDEPEEELFTEDEQEEDLFTKVVCLCARDEPHGRQAIANLVPFLGEFGHPEFACFDVSVGEIEAGLDMAKDEKEERKRSAGAANDRNRTASLLLGRPVVATNTAKNVACALDASASMDQVVDLIQELVANLPMVGIWSSFGSSQVDIDNSPEIARRMGIETSTKACNRRAITATPHSYDAKCQRFSALHGISHAHMLEMVSYRAFWLGSLFRFQTFSANLFNLAWAMYHRGQPYALVVIGDGEFDDKDALADLLVRHKTAFALCRKLVFVAAPHISNQTLHELSDMFSTFVKSTEGCVFQFLQCDSKDNEGMHRLARQVHESTKAAGSMEHIPGYQVLMSHEGPIYLPGGLDRRGLIRVFEYQPQQAWRLARLVIQVILERSTASRVLEDPIFSQLYGALIALRYNDDGELRQVCEWVMTELSTVKRQVLDAIRKTPLEDDETIARHVMHRDLVDLLIDNSKKDPEAAERAAAELEGIVAVAREEQPGPAAIRYLCRMKELSSNTLKQAIRQVAGDDGRVEEELLLVLKNLYTTDSPPAEPKEGIPYIHDKPRTIVLALSLLFKLYGCEDILVKGRPLLLLCLRYSYDLPPASVENRDGVDPTMVLLARDYLKHFTNYAVLGLVKDQGTGEWEIAEFFDFLMNPVTMRLLLRAHGDFGIIPCTELVEILRDFYRSKALLMLLNGARDSKAITLEIPVQVRPPGADGFYFSTNEYLPTDPRDPRVLKNQPTTVLNPKKKKWRTHMTYEQHMDQLGVPKKDRKALKTFRPNQYCAAPPYRPLINEVVRNARGGHTTGINVMLESLLGVSLKLHEDGSIECTSCSWTDVDLQRGVLEDGSPESWEQYWARNQGTLVKTLKFQHKAVLSAMRVHDVRREWQQRGWVAVDLQEFPVEARLAFPVFRDGTQLPVPKNKELHPESLVMPARDFLSRFALASSGEVQLHADVYKLPIPWRVLLSTEGIPEALGLNPAVLRLLLDKDRVSGTRLKFELAPDLMECYETPFDAPSQDAQWDLTFEENYYTALYNVRVKGHCHLKLNSAYFQKIRCELWQTLEQYMRVKLSLRDVDDEDAVATCWICAEDQRVGAKEFWFDLKGCCGQALCVQCLEKSTRVEALPLRLFPKCPFCASPIALEHLHHLAEDDNNNEGGRYPDRGARLRWLQEHVRRPDGSCYTEPEAREVGKRSNFSLCHECKHAIATPRNCAARVDDLPNTCSLCINALPDDAKECPSCTRHISRIDGCNNVECVCGQSICWICGEGVENHDPDHFVDGFFGNTCMRVRRNNGRRGRHGRR